MSKQQNIDLFGVVTQELGNSLFRVSLEDQPREVVCTISGKIRKNFIRIMAGDRVKLEMSPYDLTRGRIVTRIDPIRKAVVEEDKESTKKNKNGKRK
jgi:translation initiation factor IF-1